MSNQTHSPRRIAVCAALLLLAVTASSCGTALPTAPAVDTGASTSRSTGVSGTLQESGSIVIEDGTMPPGGPDITNQPPAGEVPVPTLGGGPNGNAWAWGGAKRKAWGHNK